MDTEGSKWVAVAGVNDKRLITAVFCGSLAGGFLVVQVIYQDITHSPKHWSNEETTVQYIDNIILPYVAAIRASIEEDKPALVIMDNFKGQALS